jgi:hypothetical protein
MAKMSASLASWFNTSSRMSAAKIAWAGSGLRFSNGSTATEFRSTPSAVSRLDGRDDLHEQPRDDRIDRGYLEDLASFDFPEKRHRASVRRLVAQILPVYRMWRAHFAVR